jgi:ATP-dependent DNA ligase
VAIETERVRPMLAKLERELPQGSYVYEPKWDGFRCLAYRNGDDVDLRSRHDRPLARYFPELVESLRRVPEQQFVLDGEIVLISGTGAFDFPALMARLHPAPARVELLRRRNPALYVAFDILGVGDTELLERPYAERRTRLERLLTSPPEGIELTPATADVAQARMWLERFEGVIAKDRSLAYVPGKRVMVKVKRERTADCVVAGMRWLGDRPLPSSLLLGLFDDRGELHHIGVASSFAERQRHAILAELGPLIVPLPGHPWERGFLLGGGNVGRLKGSAGRWTPDMEQEWTPIAPERVVEVSYDQLDDHRFRHPARLKRWRPDREPRSCTLAQLDADKPRDVAELLV